MGIVVITLNYFTTVQKLNSMAKQIGMFVENVGNMFLFIIKQEQCNYLPAVANNLAKPSFQACSLVQSSFS